MKTKNPLTKSDITAIRWCYRQAQENRGLFTGFPILAEYDEKLKKAHKAIGKLRA